MRFNHLATYLLIANNRSRIVNEPSVRTLKTVVQTAGNVKWQHCFLTSSRERQRSSRPEILPAAAICMHN